MTRRAHDTWSRSSISWHCEGWTPPASTDYSSRRNYLGRDRRNTRGASSSGYEDKRADWGNTGDRGNDYATEGDTDKNKDKDDASRTGKEKEAKKGMEKEKEKEQEKEKERGRDRSREKFINITKEDLWALHRVLDSRKSTLSSTYDSNQRTVAALDRLAEVYETFADTWDIVEKESAEGDMLFAAEEDAIDKNEAARQYQNFTLEVLEGCRKSLDGAFREFGSMSQKRV